MLGSSVLSWAADGLSPLGLSPCLWLLVGFVAPSHPYYQVFHHKHTHTTQQDCWLVHVFFFHFSGAFLLMCFLTGPLVIIFLPILPLFPCYFSSTLTLPCYKCTHVNNNNRNQ